MDGYVTSLVKSFFLYFWWQNFLKHCSKPTETLQLLVELEAVAAHFLKLKPEIALSS